MNYVLLHTLTDMSSYFFDGYVVIVKKNKKKLEISYVLKRPKNGFLRLKNFQFFLVNLGGGTLGEEGTTGPPKAAGKKNQWLLFGRGHLADWHGVQETLIPPSPRLPAQYGQGAHNRGGGV